MKDPKLLGQQRGTGKAGYGGSGLSTSLEAWSLTASAGDRVPGVTEDLLSHSRGSPQEGTTWEAVFLSVSFFSCCHSL